METPTYPNLHITRVRISDYRGISEVDELLGDAGVIVRGKCKTGKTSFPKAIQAALANLDAGADAIRLDSDRAEILVDVNDFRVRKLITPRDTSLTIKTSEGKPQSSSDRGGLGPQTWLTKLLGTAAFDPILFMTQNKPAERMALVLAALPITVTAEQLNDWAPEWAAEDVDITRHGLTVCADLRGIYYDRRTDANKLAETAQRELARLLAAPVAAPDIPVSEDSAGEALAQATKASSDLQAREARVAAAVVRSAATRTNIATKRDDAAQLRIRNPLKDRAELEDMRKHRDRCNDEVTRLEAELAVAKTAHTKAAILYSAAGEKATNALARHVDATNLEGAAAELEATLNASSEQPVTEAEWADAQRLFLEAQSLDIEAKATTTAETYMRELAAAKVAAEDADATAARLNDLVLTFTKTAPAALLEASNGIPGLSFEDDKIWLDGKVLDGLSQAEQLEFSVEIARRANAQSRILICDGLERLDTALFHQFVRLATADGYQLIGTRVDDGEMRFEHIELAEAG